jgi:uncharacterized damage-inducible protein DinB
VTVADARELFAYNAWANRKFFAALAALPAEPYFRDLKCSHGGIHGTLCHLVWAEALWLNRPARLDDTIEVHPSTGGAYRHTFGQMFRHAIDHSTYHRGQLVTLLRQVGATPPSTGLIVFYRERGAGATSK